MGYAGYATARSAWILGKVHVTKYLYMFDQICAHQGGQGVDHERPTNN
jgi:hypothetical protein